MASRPDFVIIGAMKCATTTLHDQLAKQAGVFMSTPKEPNFFSDDHNFAKGIGWYASLFQDAPADSIWGESSTHYTKLPTYPAAVDRFAEHLSDAKLIYVMRDPVSRLISHYIHEWSEAKITVPIDQAVEMHPELLDYSRYAMQLEPWMNRFGSDHVLPVFFERMVERPDAEFARICRFIGLAGQSSWSKEVGASNVSATRIRKSTVRDMVLDVGVLKVLRRTLLPESLRDKIKSRWRMNERPELSRDRLEWVRDQLDADITRLGTMLGIKLDCACFRHAILDCVISPEWAKPASERIETPGVGDG